MADVKKLIKAAEYAADNTTAKRMIEKYAILNEDLSGKSKSNEYFV